MLWRPSVPRRCALGTILYMSLIVFHTNCVPQPGACHEMLFSQIIADAIELGSFEEIENLRQSCGDKRRGSRRVDVAECRKKPKKISSRRPSIGDEQVTATRKKMRGEEIVEKRYLLDFMMTRL
jgi:hypothetical protein